MNEYFKICDDIMIGNIALWVIWLGHSVYQFVSSYNELVYLSSLPARIRTLRKELGSLNV